ncbi:MAG: Minor extracellular protease vpr [candidate division WS2 bacterium]|uniref:Minor extracellular protease vpr n=1 Tax=Psychracetigena formicireducens TaxID=2986056 RepID=A0A9E2BHK1_PSYF1|nr:Minor extracellular protease vpr [Candidatus Psychracetigena formicireducens]
MRNKINKIIILGIFILSIYLPVFSEPTPSIHLSYESKLLTDTDENLLKTAHELRREHLGKIGKNFIKTKNIPLINSDGETIPAEIANLSLFKEKMIEAFVLLENLPITEYRNQKGIEPESVKDDVYSDFLSGKQGEFLLQLKDLPLNITIIHTFQKMLNGFYVKLPKAELPWLRTIPGVGEIQLPATLSIDDKYALNIVKAPQAWANLGVKGEGQVIAIVDTGVDYLHPDLGGGFGAGFKVIGGYDFGDMDSDPMDLQGHGTHVAGIAAGKAALTGGVNGIAPEAKIVAYKIVRGAGGIAISGAIAASFEHMVNFRGPNGERVTSANLSFGAASGFYYDKAAHEIAMENTVRSGIFVSSSAGNHGYSISQKSYAGSSPTGRDLIYPSDIGMVASPGTANLVTSVASSNNSHQEVNSSFKVVEPGTEAPIRRTPYLVGEDSPDPVSALNRRPFEYIEVGYGNHPDYYLNKDVKGKIALILRGGLPGEDATFVNKVHQAESHGAAMAVIYNDEARGDSLVTMAGDPMLTIPRVFIGFSQGKWLKENEGKRMLFDGDNTSFVIPLLYPDRSSGFSSWGLTPEMGPKPEISAPGGSIMSTYPISLGSYQYNSGTSMASPYVAGAAALVKQHKPEFTAEMIKTTLINTADILFFPGIDLPASPRLQGSGRLNVLSALNIPAFLTGIKGENFISYGDTDYRNTISLPLKLRNISNRQLIYQPSTILLRTQPDRSPTNYEGIIPIFTKDGKEISSLVVEPQQDIIFELVLSINEIAVDYTFAEGFVTLTPSSGTNISLNLPYVFYVGDSQNVAYQNPQGEVKGFAGNLVIDPPRDEFWSLFQNTWLYTWAPGGEFLFALGVDYTGKELSKEEIAISPNGDGEQDDLSPLLSFLRGTEEFIIKVSGGSLTDSLTLFKEYWVKKNSQEDQFRLWWSDLWYWDGGGLPEGQYYVELLAKAPPDKSPGDTLTYQKVTLPLKIDNTAPLLNMTSMVRQENEVTLFWNGEDRESTGKSGVWGYLAVIFNRKGKVEFSDFLPPTATQYTFQDVSPGDEIEARVISWDNAGNANISRLDINLRPLTLTPIKGGVDTIITLSGTGFAGNTAGIAWFDSNVDGRVDSGEPLVLITTTAEGSIPTNSTLKVPDTTPGRYFIEVDIPRGGNIEASTMFTVVAPYLNVTPSRCVVGDKVEVIGFGFPGSTKGAVWFDSNRNGSIEGDEPSLLITTSLEGAIPSGTTLVIPRVPSGVYFVRADFPLGFPPEASMPIGVLPGVISLSPEKGGTGTSINISGKGFPGNVSGKLWFDANKDGLQNDGEDLVKVLTNNDGTLPSGLIVKVADVQEGFYPVRADIPEGLPIEVNANFHLLSPPFITASVSPGIINQGGTAILSWKVINAKSLTITPEIMPNPVHLTGSVTVSPQRTTNYLFQADGDGGVSEFSLTLTVIQPPPTITASVFPTSIERGKSAALTWSSTNTTSISVSPSISISPLPLSGSATVSATTTTTYVFTVSGPGGTAEFRITLTVTEPPPPPPLYRTVELRIGSTIYKVGGVVRTMDAAPYIEESRTMVPVRFLAEGLGGTVGWDNVTRTVTVRFTKPILEIRLIIGNPTATVNGRSTQIDVRNVKVVPAIRDNRTFVPLRFLVDQITGSAINWIPPDIVIMKLPR